MPVRFGGYVEQDKAEGGLLPTWAEKGLKIVGYPFQVPQSMFFAGLSGKNPLEAILHPYDYASFADVVKKNSVLKSLAKATFGENFENEPAFKIFSYTTDFVADPMMFTKAISALPKIARGGEALKIMNKIGMSAGDIDRLAKTAPDKLQDVLKALSTERYGEELTTVKGLLNVAEKRKGLGKVAEEAKDIAGDALDYAKHGRDYVTAPFKQDLVTNLGVAPEVAEKLTKNPAKTLEELTAKIEKIQKSVLSARDKRAAITELKREAVKELYGAKEALADVTNVWDPRRAALRKAGTAAESAKKAEVSLAKAGDRAVKVTNEMAKRIEDGKRITNTIGKKYNAALTSVANAKEKVVEKGLIADFLDAAVQEVKPNLTKYNKQAEKVAKAKGFVEGVDLQRLAVSDRINGLRAELKSTKDLVGTLEHLRDALSDHPETVSRVLSEATAELTKLTGLPAEDVARIISNPKELEKLIAEGTNAVPELASRLADLQGEMTKIGNVAEGLSTGNNAAKMSEGLGALSEFLQKTGGKLPTDATMAEKVRAGWAGPALHIPFTNVYKQILPETIARGLEAIPEPVKKFGDEFARWYGANVGTPVQQMLTKLTNPDFVKREIDVQGTRLGYDLIKESTETSARVANVIDKTVETLAREGADAEKIKDQVMRVVDTVYEALPKDKYKPEDIEAVLPELTKLIEHGVKYGDDIPAWEKVGMEKDLYEKIFQKLNDAGAPELIAKDSAVLDKIFGSEKEAAEVLGMPLEYTKNYLYNELRADVLEALRERMKEGSGKATQFYSLFSKPDVWKGRTIVAPNGQFLSDATRVLKGEVLQDQNAQSLITSLLGKNGSKLVNWAFDSNRIALETAPAVGKTERETAEALRKARTAFFASLDEPEKYKVVRDYIISHSAGDRFKDARAAGWAMGYWNSPVTAEINRVSRNVGIKGLEEFKGKDIFLQDFMTRRIDRTNAYRRAMGRVGAPKAFSDWAVSLGQAKKIVQMTPDEIERLSDKGWKTVGIPSLKGYMYAPDVAKAMSRMENQSIDLLMSITPKAPGILGKAIHSMTGAWKLITTAPFPAFHTRNVITDMIKGSQAGIPLSEQAKIMSVYQKPILESIWSGKALDNLPDLVLSDGRVFSGKQLAKEIESRQVGRGFFAAEVIPEYTRNPVEMRRFLKQAGIDIPKGWDKGPNAVVDYLGKAGNSSEGITRISNFIWGLQKYGDPEEAMRLVNKVNFDYEVVPEWIKKSQDLFPFIKYKYYNLPFQIEMAIKKPYILRGFYKLRDISKREFLGDKQDFETEYAKQNAMFYLPSNPLAWLRGEKTKTLGMAMEGYVPFTEPENALPQNFFSELTKLFNPMVSGMVENEFGRPIFKPDKKIEEYPGQETTLFGLPITESLKHWVTKPFRALTTIENLNPGNIFGDSETPSIFGYVSPESYTKGVPGFARLASFVGAPKIYDVKPEIAYNKRRYENSVKVSDLKREITRLSAFGESGQKTRDRLVEKYREAVAERDYLKSIASSFEEE